MTENEIFDKIIEAIKEDRKHRMTGDQLYGAVLAAIWAGVLTIVISVAIIFINIF